MAQGHSHEEGHDHGDSHMHDFEAHVRAVEEDLEYWRAKRFESRVLRFARRRIVSFHDLIRAGARVSSWTPPPNDGDNFEARIRALEDALDDYVRGVGLATPGQNSGAEEQVIEDNRKERGDYDDFFRILKPEHGGSLRERIDHLEVDMTNYHFVLNSFVQALIDRGLLSEEELEQRRAAMSSAGEWNGARIVARAWVDEEFKQNLLSKGREAVRELGIPPGRLGRLGVAENTPGVHNVVVCTLCSCYPYDLLGDTPWWYKNDVYKQRIIAEPRTVLDDMFALKVPADREIRVHDSTSDIRWMVLPMRPAGSEGLTEEELRRLVTPDSLIGVEEARDPTQLASADSPRARTAN